MRVLVSLASFLLKKNCFVSMYGCFFSTRGNHMEKKMYVSNMDWTPAVDSMDDLKCQERVISFSMSTLKLLQRDTNEFFFVFFNWRHTILEPYKPYKSKSCWVLQFFGCILISSCHLVWFFSHQKTLSAEAPRAVVSWATPAASEVLWCRCGANGIASKVAFCGDTMTWGSG